MIERIVCVVILLLAIGAIISMAIENMGLSEEIREANRINSGLAKEIEAREAEVQAVENKAQCYHEECVRLAFEYMSDTVYVLPCDGREIAIGGAR